MTTLVKELTKKRRASEHIMEYFHNLNHARDRLNKYIMQDIEYRLAEKFTTLDNLAKDTGIARTVLSRVKNGHRKMTAQQVKQYVYWLRENGY